MLVITVTWLFVLSVCCVDNQKKGKAMGGINPFFRANDVTLPLVMTKSTSILVCLHLACQANIENKRKSNTYFVMYLFIFCFSFCFV